ncbi:heavy metal-associated isoprenylated plant protein 3 [Gossypium raimondii]|uniref:HMA domain-containing protein n=2 Tax=Gossypium raimondii TaxID=29730 RepID=A0A0D2N0Y7_GOSRA|nr:heavy metal-associated isoprenylated plant protein 3 [Gossypium raimondii]KJB25542.1 hypothetical protein B456_004G231000 [Gossypium raimondii]
MGEKKNGNKQGGGDGKMKEKSSSTSVFKPDQQKNQDSDNKSDKKPKKAPVRTADLKVQFGCQCNGCFDRISKIVSETKGVREFKVDRQKEMVRVKGTMDIKALAKALKDKLKKHVEIVAPKKEKDGKEGGDGGKKKNKGGGEDGGNEANGGKMEGKGTEFYFYSIYKLLLIFVICGIIYCVTPIE